SVISSAKLSAQASASNESTNCPLTPLPTTVASPPTLWAITAVPQAWASAATSPKDSDAEGMATASAARIQLARTDGETGEENEHCCAMPSRLAYAGTS